MRIHRLVRNLSLLVAASLPALALAQFQQPTAEELKMTGDPNAPGAAAVFLNVEEIANDPIHFHSFYARIKVLAEKGKDLATVEIPYFYGRSTVEAIKARTIHSDGTVVPLIGKPEDLLSVKKGEFQVDRTIFTLPSVEVGSILEYRYEIRYDREYYYTPSWKIQRPYLVRKAHYAWTPSWPFQSWTVLPPGVQVKKDVGGQYTVDLTDIPPIPDEEWMPPIDSLLYQVNFYHGNNSNPNDFWIAQAKFWSGEIDRFAKPTKSIHEAVYGLIAPGDSDIDKARKLYKAVQALDNTDFSRRKDASELKQLKLKEAKRAEDTWAQKSGSGVDISLLYLALVRAAGLVADNMSVVNRDRGAFAPNYLDLNQLNGDIAILKIDGKEIYVDPGEKMCPFQTIHWKHSGATGIRQGADGRALSTTPLQPYMANKVVRTGDLTLDGHGGVTGSFRIEMTGQEALRWRQAALNNDQGEVSKQFNEWLESIVPNGVEAHLDRFQGLQDSDSTLVAMVKVKGILGIATPKRFLLPAFFFDTRYRQPFVGREMRQVPVDMHYASHVTDLVVYRLPSGMAVEGVPQDTKIPWQDHAVFQSKTVVAPGQITIADSLARAFTLVKPEEYQDLRGFYLKVTSAMQQQVILRPSAAKGD